MKLRRGNTPKIVVYSNVAILGLGLLFFAFDTYDRFKIDQRMPERPVTVQAKALKVIQSEDNPDALLSLIQKNREQLTPQQIRYLLSDSLYKKRDNTFVALLKQYDSLVSPNERQRLLSNAVSLGSYRVAELLLEQGVDPNQGGTEGIYPIHWACIRSDNALIQFLIDKKANVNQPITKGYPFSERKAADVWRKETTPLMQSVISANAVGVRLLLEHGVDKNRRDGENRTALDLAESYAQGPLLLEPLDIAERLIHPERAWQRHEIVQLLKNEP